MGVSKQDYDFSGWATKNDLRCSDGRTIRRDAFKECDGITVPLVWNHQHDGIQNILGHALLVNRPEGVYAYGKFNETEDGQTGKKLVVNGDITGLSIYANQLKQKGGDVLHGKIREVSLVLASANPGAFIDSVVVHGEGQEEEEEATIYSGEQTLFLSHADEVEEEPDKSEQPEQTETEPTEEPSKEESAIEHSDDNKEEEPKKMAEEAKEKTVQDVWDEFTDEQKTVVYAMIGQAIEDAGAETNKEGEGEDMKHNVFESDKESTEQVLSHDEIAAIFADAKRFGSLKESVLQHGIDEVTLAGTLQHSDPVPGTDYGITDIGNLFPDAKSMNVPPAWIKRDTTWVADVMNGVHHVPFSRVKSMWANITADDARAKGYLKAHQKAEEVFPVFKRTTPPQTVYKKQKLDRDDILDITDFDVVAWLKSEMRIMLDEELARAFLVGDGRSDASDDKINPLNIRPIWQDNSVFTVNKVINVASDATDDQKAKAIIRGAVKARKDYKGSGNPVFFTTEDILTDMLLMEDTTGRVIYETEDKLRSALRVRKIVTVPVMEGLTRAGTGTDTGKTFTLVGIIVNLNDYTVGADKGGSVNMFDDFDIDYNAQKYLIETRCSGAMTTPYGAITLEMYVNP